MPGTAAPRCGPASCCWPWWPPACGTGKRGRSANAAPSYITQTVVRGNLTLTVTANGTLQPTRSISIGSELSGTVLKVNVDVNDQVKKGQVLVELDTAKLRDQILRSRASLAAAKAKVAQTVATVKEARASLARFEEVARLSGGKVPSKTELDTARATLERAHRRRGQRPRQRQRRAGGAVHRRDQPVEGVDQRARRRRGADAQRGPRQRGGGIAAGGDAVHHGRGPEQAAPLGLRR